MKQLLTWCGERALARKPPHDTPNSNAIFGARAIQDQLLKDFTARSEFSDWFSREDDAPKIPIVLRPNPRNMELDEKLAQLKINIKRLQDEKKAWQAIRKPLPAQPPLFYQGETGRIVLPDFDLLGPNEGKIRGFLSDETASFAAVRSQTESRLRTIQSSLEFQVDQLADNVHKLEQRVLVAGKEADKVLSVSALRLRQRDNREKASARTRDMPVIEVLRSLGNILPERGG
jgi:kinetochore protein Mis13/DSN1